MPRIQDASFDKQFHPATAGGLASTGERVQWPFAGTHRILQIWSTGDFSETEKEILGLGQAIADTDWDTVERHSGLQAVVGKFDQAEEETAPWPAQDGSTISASGGRGRGVVEVATLQSGGGARRWLTRWRTLLTTATLLSQRAKPSPLWSRLCPETRIGRGLARIARVLRGKAPCGAGIACPPPRTARRGAALEGEEVEGATPIFSPLMRQRRGVNGPP